MLLWKLSVSQGHFSSSALELFFIQWSIFIRCFFKKHGKHLWDISTILGCMCIQIPILSSAWQSDLLSAVLFQVFLRASLQPLSLLSASPHLQHWPWSAGPPALLLITKAALENFPERIWWRKLLKNRQMGLLVCKLLLHSAVLSQSCCWACSPFDKCVGETQKAERSKVLASLFSITLKTSPTYCFGEPYCWSGSHSCTPEFAVGKKSVLP